MEKVKLYRTQRFLYDYILQEYKTNGKFVETNRQLGYRFGLAANSMQHNIKVLQQKGLIECKTVLEPSGYVVRYVTPTNLK